jgi:macrolide transport system ATP-binding/permease protein
MTNPVPPIARWMLRHAASRSDRESIIADLEEEATAHASKHGWPSARRWSRRQALRSIPPLLRQRTAGGAVTARRTLMMLWRALQPDMRVTLRRLWQAPGFAIVCILTLALGIGGNTAVFTLIDRAMLKPLPVTRPHELYRVGNTDDCCVNGGLPSGSFSLFSYDLYLHLRDAAPQFSELAAFQANANTLTVGRMDAGVPPETLRGSFVSGNYFAMFDLSPAAGRLLAASDDRRGAAPVAVLSYRLWIRMHARSRDVVGSTVTLNGVAATIVGVAPEGFYGEMLRPDPADLWVPLSAEPLLRPSARLLEAKQLHWLYLIGRLRPAQSVPALEGRLTAVLQQWLTAKLELRADERARIPQQYLKIVPAAAGVSNMRTAVGPSLRLLQIIAAAVLLIACANLANLLLARGMSRRTETAVRLALGGSRARLAAEFMAEAVALAFLGGIAGLALSYAGARAIVGMAFRGATYIPIDSSPSLLVVGFAVALSVVTGLVFGAAPAMVESRSDPMDAMRGAGRTTGERGPRLRRSLIALQVSLSLVLVSCAGLLALSLDRLQHQEFGFLTTGRYVASVHTAFGSGVSTGEMAAVYARLTERVREIPGVANAAFSLYSPMSGDNWSSGVAVEGGRSREREGASWNRVSPGYFETIGTPVLRGRTFTQRDGPDAPAVAVVSERFAERYVGKADPIGRRFGFVNERGESRYEFEIVGVVGDAKYQDAKGPPYPTFFVPFLQLTDEADAPSGPPALNRSHFAKALEMHVAAPVPDLDRQVRQALADVDRRFTVGEVTTMDEQVARNFNLERLIARLTVAFGAVAMLLASLGLYGVTAYSVSRRTREIGIRMALGSTSTGVLTTVLRGALGQVAIGVAVGVPATVWAGRLLQSQLFGVSGHEPAVLVGGVIVLVLSATIAALIPAQRAAAMDPARALRID